MNLTALPKPFGTSTHTANGDRTQQRDIENALCQRFFKYCDRTARDPLTRCQWKIVLKSNRPILTISCPSTLCYWQVIQAMDAIGASLIQISQQARIRLYRPLGLGIPLEVRVDEL
jgi:hypothetical protein